MGEHPHTRMLDLLGRLRPRQSKLFDGTDYNRAVADQITERREPGRCLLLALFGSGLMSELSPKDDEKRTSSIVKFASKSALSNSNPKGK
jgi:hypothetical protein